MGMKRKAHQKSRMGCSACKRKRIKCDETRPQCSHCVRNKVPCLYPVADRVSVSLRSTTPQPLPRVEDSPPRPALIPIPNGASLNAVVAPQPSPPETSFTIADMALLHHWTLVTSRSIVSCPHQSCLWQTVYPNLAFQHSYMMHAILSLAALHLIHLHQSESSTYLPRATHHHALALHGFRHDIKTITSANADAAFGTATLIFLHAFITSTDPHTSHPNTLATASATATASRTNRILGSDWIPLVRGIQAILAPAYEHVCSGPLQSTLHLQHWTDLTTDLPSQSPDGDDNDNDNDNDNQADTYLLHLRTTWRHDPNAPILDETLHLLRRTRAWIARYQRLDAPARASWGYNGDWSAPFLWASFVSEAFFTLLAQRQPLALLVFGHFGAVVQGLSEFWWVGDSGRQIVEVVGGLLGLYWEPWMAWPRRVVGLSCEEGGT